VVPVMAAMMHNDHNLRVSLRRRVNTGKHE
jgi:hypothetical protein